MADPAPYRFALVAHSQDLVDSVRAVADGKGYTLEWRLVDFETAVPVAERCLAEGADVIICHGGTGNRIARALGNSTVVIDRTDMDVIRAIREASCVDREIVIAAHQDEHHDVALIEQLLGVTIHLVSYTDTRLLFATLEQLYARGIHVLVGGGVTKQGMDALGGKGFVIAANRHSIMDALDRAKGLAAQKRREMTLHENLLALFRQLDQGVVCIGEEGKPLFVNSKAAKFLELSVPYADCEAEAAFRHLRLFDTLREGKEHKDVLTEIHGQQFVVTTLPVTTRLGRLAAALFRDVPSLQKINRKIGEELYAKGFVSRYTLEAIKGTSALTQTLKAKVSKFADAQASVLIYGETGSGKELVAHSLHAGSSRATRPFVAVNFAALPENLLESELFGYEEGAFTGARRGGKAGLFELAHKGTLFLDEVGEISHEMQLRLLRVIETKEVMRVGGSRLLPVDVRIISASHRALPELAAEGRFRLDLYYRLATLKIHVPPLRERADDIPEILQPLLLRHGRTERVLDGGVTKALVCHPWPGNIRELLAVMESYLVLLERNTADSALLTAILHENAVPAPAAGTNLFVPGTSLKEQLNAIREQIIEEAICYHNGDKKSAARHLGVSYTTLWRTRDTRPSEFRHQAQAPLDAAR